MTNPIYKYVWRCAKCSSHFASISKVDGVLLQEKKCSKCKSLNKLMLSESEIRNHCMLFDQKLDAGQEAGLESQVASF